MNSMQNRHHFLALARNARHTRRGVARRACLELQVRFLRFVLRSPEKREKIEPVLQAIDHLPLP